MQIMSNDFNNIVKSGNALYYITVIDNNGDILDLEIDNFEYIGAKCSDNNLTFGNTPCQSVRFSIHNPDILLENKELEIKQGLYVNGELESLRIGYFTIQKPTSDGEVTQYIGYDRMAKFERPYFTSLTSGYSVSAVLNEIETQTGVKINLPEGTNYNLSKKPEGFTRREILGYIAGLYGCDAIVNRDGEIVFKWYSEIEVEVGYAIDGNRIYQGTTIIGSEYNYVLQKIECTVIEGDTDTTLTVGAGTQGIFIENPFMTQEILNDIFNKIGGFEFRPLSTEFLGDFRLDLGDIVAVVKDSVTYKIPIMEIRHQSDGGVRTTITASAETESEQQFEVKGPSTKAMERYYADLVLINEAMINKLDVETAKITYATISELQATNVTVAGKLDTNELAAKVATLGYLKADTAEITYAKITELNALHGDISLLDVDVANIKSIMAGNIGTGDLTSIKLNSQNATIDTAFLKTLLAENITVADLMAGVIYTDDFNILSKDGSMQIKGATQQFLDENGIVRIQIGKDNQGNFTFTLFDETGIGILIDTDGIHEDAVGNELIVDRMVASNAAIQASKLDIESLFRVINNSSETIASSRIYFNEQQQSLNQIYTQITKDVTTANDNATSANSTAQSASDAAEKALKAISGISTLSALGANLSSDSTVVHTNTDGTGGDYSNCVTTFTVFLGDTDVSSQSVISYEVSEGVKGNYNELLRTFTVTDMTTDNGYVDFTALYGTARNYLLDNKGNYLTDRNGNLLLARSGGQTVTKRFSISKAPDGNTGISYRLQSSATVVNKSADGTLTPNSITYNSLRSSNGTMLQYTGQYLIETSSDGITYTQAYKSNAPELTHTFTPTADMLYVRCTLYDVLGTNSLDTLSTVILTDASELVNDIDLLKRDVETTTITVAEHTDSINEFSREFASMTTEIYGIKEGNLMFQTPYVLNSGIYTFTAKIYKAGRNATDEYAPNWFEWYKRTESEDIFLGYGKSIKVNQSDMGFGGVIVGVFTTYGTALLTDRNGNYLTIRNGNRLIARSSSIDIAS